MYKKIYTVIYKDRRNAHESKEKEVSIDLKEYNDSYADNQFILGQYYPKNMVNAMIYTDKVDFLSTKLQEELGKNVFVRKDEFKKLVSQLDTDVKCNTEA